MGGRGLQFHPDDVVDQLVQLRPKIADIRRIGMGGEMVP